MRKFNFRIHSLRRYACHNQLVWSRTDSLVGDAKVARETREKKDEKSWTSRTEKEEKEERRTDDRTERKRVFLAVTHCCWLLRTTLNRALPLSSAYKLTQRSRIRYKRDTHEREISLPNIVFLTKGSDSSWARRYCAKWCFFSLMHFFKYQFLTQSIHLI